MRFQYNFTLCHGVLHGKCDFPMPNQACIRKIWYPQMPDDIQIFYMESLHFWKPLALSSVCWSLIRACLCGQGVRIHWKWAIIQEIRGWLEVYGPWFICQVWFSIFRGLFGTGTFHKCVFSTNSPSVTGFCTGNAILTAKSSMCPQILISIDAWWYPDFLHGILTLFEAVCTI